MVSKTLLLTAFAAMALAAQQSDHSKQPGIKTHTKSSMHHAATQSSMHHAATHSSMHHVATQPSGHGPRPSAATGPHKPGDKIQGKKVTELSNGVYGGNEDGSFTFLADASSSAGHPHSKSTMVDSRLFARSAFPGAVTCESSEGIVDQYDLNNAISNFEQYCGSEHSVSGHSYAFTKYDQAVVYMCEQGSQTGFCKAPEIKAAAAAIGATCPNGESGYSSMKSTWYKTYGYKVASDAKICGQTP